MGFNSTTEIDYTNIFPYSTDDLLGSNALLLGLTSLERWQIPLLFFPSSLFSLLTSIGKIFIVKRYIKCDEAKGVKAHI